MGQTYEPTQLATDETYQVRLLLGDTVAGRMVLEDEEIDWFLSQEANVYMAAAAACDQISLILSAGAGASGVVTRKRVGQTDISYANGRDAKGYTSLAASLRARGRTHQSLYAGGISVADKALRALDQDVPPGGIKRGQFDNTDAIPER